MVAFIISPRIERRYKGWGELWVLMKDFHYDIAIFDHDANLPGYVKTPTMTSLKENLLKCNSYIADDSGVMHLADYLKIPGLAIFGPTNMIKSGPVNGFRISKGLDCSPCFRKGKVNCTENFHCLNIKPNEVLHYFQIWGIEAP